MAAEELALARREATLASREEAAVEELVAARAQQSALFRTLQLLAGDGVPGAVELLASLPPALAVPPSAARAQAIVARTEAASRRRTGCERRSAILGSVTAGLTSNAGLLARATATTAKLAAALAEERRIAAARAEERPAAPPATAATAAAAVEAAPTATTAAATSKATTAAAAPTATTAAAAPPAAAPLSPPVAAGPRPDPRRTAERVKFVREIGLHTDSNFFTGFSQNLSSGGLFVAAFDQPLPIGSEVDVTFSLPGGPPVECRARVRWVRELRDHTPDVWPGMGLEFIDLGSAEQAQVHSFLAAREPLFYPD